MPLPPYPGESVSCTHCIRGWVGPRTGLNDVKYPPHATYVRITDMNLVFTVKSFSREVSTREAVETLSRILGCEIVSLPYPVLIAVAVWP